MALTVISIFLFQGLIFLGLIFLLRQFMKGNVRGELGHLERLNTEMLKRESELKQKIAATEQEYQTRMAKLELEANAKQAQIKQEANHLLDESRDLAKKERERIINEAIETRDKIRNEIMASMENTAIDYSSQIIDEFFSGENRKILHDILFRQLIEGIESVNMEHFQIKSQTAHLKAAEELSSEDKKQIRETLKKKIHRDIEFTEEKDPQLIGGAILQFDNFVIDGSMINLLKEAAARLKKEAHRRYQGTV